MTDLPNWVYDVVIELQRWADEHPKLYRYMAENDYQPFPDCGCEALERVPEDVRERAKAIRAYVSDVDHQRARMGVPVDTVIDADGKPLWRGPATLYQPEGGTRVSWIPEFAAETLPGAEPGPWQHTCKLPGLTNGRQAKPCPACAAERAGDL